MTSSMQVFLIVAILLLQKGLAQQPNCINYQDGYMSPDLLNPNHYYLCHLRIPVPMACPAGLVFCAIAGMNICTLNCQSPNPIASGNNMPPNSWIPPAGTSVPNQEWPTAATDGPYQRGPTAAPMGSNEGLPTAPTPRPQAVPNGGFPTAPMISSTAAPNLIPTAATEAPESVILECAKQPDGIVVPIPGNCSGYATCVNGKPVVGNCLSNRAFDPSIGVCSESVCSN